MFYELAFHFNPHCAEACNNLGVLYKDRDNLDKAVECYQVLNLQRFMIVSLSFVTNNTPQPFVDGSVNQTKFCTVA